MPSMTTLARTMQHTLSTAAGRHARSSLFIQRQRTLTASAFCEALVFGWLQHATASLPQLAQMLATRHVTMSVQGLDRRCCTLSHERERGFRSHGVPRSRAKTRILHRWVECHRGRGCCCVWRNRWQHCTRGIRTRQFHRSNFWPDSALEDVGGCSRSPQRTQ